MSFAKANTLHCLILVLLSLIPIGVSAQRPLKVDKLDTVNPLDYGILEARDGKERYEVLYAAHSEACQYRRPLSYAGIDTIRLEIPDGAKSLPLPAHTDFAGVVIFVRNDSQGDITLFTLGNNTKAQEIEVERWQIDSGDFRRLPQLAKGDYLLIVNDRNVWTSREGYGYECFRSDLLYVRDGQSLNRPVTTYSNPAADPRCSFVPVTTERKTVENLTIHRVRGSAHKTYCINVSNQNHVLIRNVLITTPIGKFIADGAITLRNSANCTLEDVTIDSTYSVPGGYGYGISMGNVWNTTFTRLVADGAWGVFGSNNVSQTTLRQCDVNRFDIHCYGRDVRCVDCTFRNKQTQFSSMYGTVIFDSCHFIDCIPVRIRSSYNAYTPFDIVIRHCTFDVTLRYHALVNVMLLSTEPNPRPELAPRCWPNLYVEDLTVNLPPLTRRLTLFHPSGTLSECDKPVDYLGRIEVRGLRTLRNGRPMSCEIKLSSHRFRTAKPLTLILDNIQNGDARIVNLINR